MDEATHINESAPPTKQPDPELAWINKIADLGNRSKEQGYLGRIKGSDWLGDRFYFLRDLG